MSKIIHAAIYYPEGRGRSYLLLMEEKASLYRWVDEASGAPSTVVGETIDEALRLANNRWKDEGFKMVGCGFRYTLPERDEHGNNALFHQMAASYSSMNGIYFDEELGHNCYVQNASDEALELWRRKERGPHV